MGVVFWILEGVGRTIEKQPGEFDSFPHGFQDFQEGDSVAN